MGGIDRDDGPGEGADGASGEVRAAAALSADADARPSVGDSARARTPPRASVVSSSIINEVI